LHIPNKGTLFAHTRLTLFCYNRKLEKMRASDELADDETRQLLFDVENSYNQFMQLLGGKEGGSGWGR